MPPESASHDSSRSSGLRVIRRAIGAATQRLRQLKQSINLPAVLLSQQGTKSHDEIGWPIFAGQ